jgi:uncharacterized RDD family membrane protein YckC
MKALSPDAASAASPRRDGVVFAPGDLASFGRRLIASVVDGMVLFLIWAVVFNVWVALKGTTGFNGATLGPAGMLAAFLYLGPVKRSRLRTVGYRLAGVRLVSLWGDRPSLPALALRGGLYLLGGFAGLDFLWFLVVKRRQKLSDQLAGTYVVHAGAQPAGRGPVITAYYAGFGYFLVMSEVVPVLAPARKEVS